MTNSKNAKMCCLDHGRELPALPCLSGHSLLSVFVEQLLSEGSTKKAMEFLFKFYLFEFSSFKETCNLKL